MRPFTRQCVRAIKYLQSLLHWIVTGPIFCVFLGIFVGWHVATIISYQIEFGSEPEQSSDTVRIHENITSILENETERVFPFEDNEHRDERIIADFVASKVRVFCWIATEESRHRTNAKAVNSTWAQRCNKHLFVSTQPDKVLPAIDLGITNKKRSSWQKTRAMLQLIHDHFIDRYDWFLAAQDDSYVILENLRYMLLQYSPDDAIVLASHTFSFPFSSSPYASNGAPSLMPGFILSRGAVRRIVTDGLVNSPSCYGDSKKNEAEATMGCFQESRVRFVDTRDRNNAHSILPLKPQDHVPPHQLVYNTSIHRWLESASIHEYPSGMECCSEYPISFHNVPFRMLYSMEFFIYRQRIFGVDRPAMRNGDEKMVWLQLFGETMEAD